MQSQAPPVRDLVLLGGGHSHVQVLKSFGMRPIPGVRLTIIAREVLTPYSGMLPGYIAGIYEKDEIHIDLCPLAVFANARLIADEAIALDVETCQVELARHLETRFDLLSINSGVLPAGVNEHVIPVKPIGRFLPQWERVKQTVKVKDCVTIVGAGAGGVELALSMRRALPSGVALELPEIPALPGALELLATGVTSSLQNNNEQASADFAIDPGCDRTKVRLLADPQTAGGLLAGVPAAHAEACLRTLQETGYPQAAIIGSVHPGGWCISA